MRTEQSSRSDLRWSWLQLIPDMPSGHSALVFACLVALRRLFLWNRKREGPGLGELIHVRRRRASVDATLVRQLPREACDLAIVQPPFWDLTCARKLGLFL
jgi:hypothetical protein